MTPPIDPQSRLHRAAMPRIRFSLKTLFVVLLVGTLAGSHVFTSYRLKKTHDENVKLRTALGYLTIEDRSKVHVVRLPTHEDLTWKWRVFVPEKSEIAIRAATHEIPESGWPANCKARMTFQPGEFVVTAAVRRDRNGKWELVLGAGGSESLFPIPESAAKWLDQKAGVTYVAAGESTIKTQEPGTPLRLLRVLPQVPFSSAGGAISWNFDESVAIGKPKRVGDGLMIWIDEPTIEEINRFDRDRFGRGSGRRAGR